MSIVVTGGAGFIGANLSRRLCEQGGEVVVLDDLSTGSLDNLRDLDVTFVQGTILDPDTLDAAMRGAEAVVHLAARPSVPRSLSDPVASHLVNASGTVEVLEAARRAGSPHVVVASSSSVYGANPVLPKHEDLATLPLSPYAASKLATESYALAYQHSFGVPTLAFRFFNVFGPLQAAGHAYAAVVPMFVSAALEGRPLTVHGDGKQTRDFTYIDTVTEVIADAIARHVTSPTPVNLAFGTRTDLLTLIAELESILDVSLTVEHVEPRRGDVKHSQADSTRLAELFPAIVPTPLPEALRATVDWFRAS
ncbi:MAG TPA: NAD-dependent epimerase/dehydratase family protein [Acidimicrobiia bacterium]